MRVRQFETGDGGPLVVGDRTGVGGGVTLTEYSGSTVGNTTTDLVVFTVPDGYTYYAHAEIVGGCQNSVGCYQAFAESILGNDGGSTLSTTDLLSEIVDGSHTTIDCYFTNDTGACTITLTVNGETGETTNWKAWISLRQVANP